MHCTEKFNIIWFLSLFYFIFSKYEILKIIGIINRPLLWLKLYIELYILELGIYYHRTPLVQWSLHKYKYLWGIGGKDRGSNL